VEAISLGSQIGRELFCIQMNLARSRVLPFAGADQPGDVWRPGLGPRRSASLDGMPRPSSVQTMSCPIPDAVAPTGAL
jgi:hypothetical protein